jgi:hypothetical protein
MLRSLPRSQLRISQALIASHYPGASPRIIPSRFEKVFKAGVAQGEVELQGKLRLTITHPDPRDPATQCNMQMTKRHASAQGLGNLYKR